MSTVEVEYREATCPRCGALASEYLERLLQPGELVDMCDCGVEPEYTPVSCYQAVCDHCGHHQEDYGDWSAIGPTPEDMWDLREDWQHIGGRDLCPRCWFINDNDEVQEVTT